MAVERVYYQSVLILVARGLAGAGVTLLALSLATDVMAHVAGWHELEPGVHVAVFVAMVATFAGIVLRGVGPSTMGKERVHASR